MAGLARRFLLVLALMSVAAGLSASPAAAPAAGQTVLRLKLAPHAAAVFLDGRELALAEAGNGARAARVPAGRHELLVTAEGYVAERRQLEAAGKRLELEVKLERSGSPLRLKAMGDTGARPKSVAYTPDGKLLVLPLLSGSGADVLDAATLSKVGRLQPPLEYARAEGFVESAYLASRDEIWVSQMHNSMIHVFDRASLSYKASFRSGGSYPKVIAFSAPVAPGRERAFVSNWVSGDVSVFDAATHELLRRVKVGGTPRGLAPSPDGKSLYIACFGSGAIFRLDLGDYSLKTFWKADGGAKRHLVVDASRNRLYATDMARDSLFAFDLASGALLAEVRIGSNPNGCVLSRDGRYVFACTRGPNGEDGYEKPGPLAGELVAVDSGALRVAWRQWGGNQPTGIALSPDGASLVFTDFLDRRVELYSLLPPL
jgi:YVTN family beta-propeller protein